MKKSLLFMTLFALTHSVNAQVFWNRVASTFVDQRRIVSISYANANDVWFHVGANGPSPTQIQQFARSTDGGNTWNNGTVNLGNAGLGIANIEALSATTAYVCAFVPVGGAGGGIWKTIDSGATWVNQPTALFNTAGESFPDFVTFWDANEGLAVGDPAGGYLEIYRTLNGGTNWTRTSSATIPPILAGEFAITDQFQVIGNTVWFSTNKGRIYKSIDKGANWTVTQTLIDTFLAPGKRFIFSTATNGLLKDDAGTFYQTNDGGLTYTDLFPSGTLRIGNICAVPGLPNVYLINGNDLDFAQAGSSYTCDGGLNWTNINVLGDTFAVLPDEMEFFSPSNGIAGGLNVDALVGGVFKYVGTQLSNCNLAITQFSSDKLFTLSPNPTSDKLTLTGENINQVQITDILGKVVLNNTYATLSNIDLNIAEFNAGIYLVKVTNNEGKSSVVKVVKQ